MVMLPCNVTSITFCHFFAAHILGTNFCSMLINETLSYLLPAILGVVMFQFL